MTTPFLLLDTVRFFVALSRMLFARLDTYPTVANATTPKLIFPPRRVSVPSCRVEWPSPHSSWNPPCP